MMTVVDQFLHSALTLDSGDRAEIAHRLLLSLEPADDGEGVDEAWAVEIRRRLAAVRSGEVQFLDWNESLSLLRREVRPAEGA